METTESKKNRDHEAFDFDWIEFTYSCLLKCTSCGEIVSNVGNGFLDADMDVDETGNYYQVYNPYFRAKYFMPMLRR